MRLFIILALLWAWSCASPSISLRFLFDFVCCCHLTFFMIFWPNVRVHFYSDKNPNEMETTIIGISIFWWSLTRVPRMINENFIKYVNMRGTNVNNFLSTRYPYIQAFCHLRFVFVFVIFMPVWFSNGIHVPSDERTIQNKKFANFRKWILIRQHKRWHRERESERNVIQYFKMFTSNHG